MYNTANQYIKFFLTVFVMPIQLNIHGYTLPRIEGREGSFAVVLAPLSLVLSDPSAAQIVLPLSMNIRRLFPTTAVDHTEHKQMNNFRNTIMMATELV
jgi:hypothetical protein